MEAATSKTTTPCHHCRCCRGRECCCHLHDAVPAKPSGTAQRLAWLLGWHGTDVANHLAHSPPLLTVPCPVQLVDGACPVEGLPHELRVLLRVAALGAAASAAGQVVALQIPAEQRWHLRELRLPTPVVVERGLGDPCGHPQVARDLCQGLPAREVVHEALNLWDLLAHRADHAPHGRG